MEKVAIVTRNMKAGGAERVIAQLSNHFVKRATECTIITLDDEEVFYNLDNKVVVYPIGKLSNNAYIDKFMKYREVRRYLTLNRHDIVLALPEEIGIFVLPALLGCDIPVVVSERNNPKVMPWKKETRFLRRLFYPFATGFVFQTEEAASFFSKNIQKKGVVLPNPLDLDRIPNYAAEKRLNEVVGAGRLEKQKNFPLLIKAFAKFHNKHPDYKLTIYGEGSMRNELENLASSLLPKAAYSFPGRTSKLLECMSEASMFVLSSDYEGMPNVVIEAMAMGMPVISTDCPSGGSRDLIENGKNGILVPVGNEELLSSAMSKIANSESFAKELGMNAQNIKASLDSVIVAEKWRKFLNECIK